MTATERDAVPKGGRVAVAALIDTAIECAWPSTDATAVTWPAVASGALFSGSADPSV